MRTIAFALIFALLPVALGASPAKTHTALEKTVHFDIRSRPGSRAGAAVDRVAVMAERDLADICRQLEFTPEGRFTIYLYDDVPELQLILGRPVGGLSAGRTTHIPHDNDQTRYHELTHLVTALLPKAGDEPRNMFFPDGLANALLTWVHGVHVHAVAKFYRTRKKLPGLKEVAEGDFYAWLEARRGFNGYDVAASWFRFLLDTYGIENVKRYYAGMPAKKAFGIERKKIEKAWHAALDAFPMRKEVEILLARRNGESARFTPLETAPDRRIPKEILGKKSDWRSLTKEKLRPRDGTTWKREGNGITASGPGGWHVCELGTRKYGNCMIRAKIRTEGRLTGVQIQLGDKAAAMLNWDALYIWRGESATGGSTEDRLPESGEVDLLIIRRGHRLEAWVDGHRAASGTVDDTPHPIGIGFHTGGKVTFSDIRVRVLE